jgi:hypothetical protein
VNYEQENATLAEWGFHLAYDAEDSADYPKETNPEGELWQLGSRDHPQMRVFSREEALEYVRAKEA